MTPERDPFEIVENLWRSDANRSADNLNAQRQILARRLRFARRRFVLGLSLAAGVLAAATVALALGLPIERGGPSNIVLLGAARRSVAGVRPLPSRTPAAPPRASDPERSLADSLRALLDHNRRAQTRVRTIALLHLASVPLLAIAVRQLEQGGKVEASEVGSLATVLALLLVTTWAVLAYRYFAELRPRERALRSVLAGYVLPVGRRAAVRQWVPIPPPTGASTSLGRTNEFLKSAQRTASSLAYPPRSCPLLLIPRSRWSHPLVPAMIGRRSTLGDCRPSPDSRRGNPVVSAGRLLPLSRRASW